MKQENLDLVIALRRELHQNPELSREEKWTKQRLMDFLAEHTDLEIFDKGSWFYAAYRYDENAPNIAFRADFDALPMDEVIDISWASKNEGVAHKCGHDGHSATLCGFALEVDQVKPKKNIFFLFQHAEEIGYGAAEAVELIELEKIDEIYGWHNWSGYKEKKIVVKEGTLHFASKGASIYFEGSPAHASQPEDGKNPSFAIAELIQSVSNFTKKEDNKGLVLATIVHIEVGKKAFGMSADKGVLRMTIRAYYEDELDKLQENIENKARELAEEYGLKVSFEYLDEFPETANHSENNEKIRRSAGKAGYEVYELQEAIRSSEDYGHYTKATKGAMFHIGNGVDYPQIHTSEYDFNENLITVASDIYKELIKSE